MTFIKQITRWEVPYQKMLLLILRVAVGIIITFKGILFLSSLPALQTTLQHSSLSMFATHFWIYYIVFANLFCGVFVIFGLFTRVMFLLQLPVLIGAMFFIYSGKHFLLFNCNFILSLLILIAAAYFLVKGSGEFSMDNYLWNHE